MGDWLLFNFLHGLWRASIPCYPTIFRILLSSCQWISDTTNIYYLLPPPHNMPDSLASQSFQWVSSHEVAKYWSFWLQQQSYNKYSGLIPLGLTGLTSLAVRGSQVFYHSYSSASFLGHLLTRIHFSHLYISHSFDYMDFVGKVMCLSCNTTAWHNKIIQEAGWLVLSWPPG